MGVLYLLAGEMLWPVYLTLCPLIREFVRSDWQANWQLGRLLVTRRLFYSLKVISSCDSYSRANPCCIVLGLNWGRSRLLFPLARGSAHIRLAAEGAGIIINSVSLLGLV